MANRIPDFTRTLHLSIDGKAACDGRELSKTLDSSSPECRDIQPCRTCLLLAEHNRREQQHQRRKRT